MYKVYTFQLSEIDKYLISAWANLESRSVEANPFLSPYFVIPALKYLEQGINPLFLFVFKELSGSSQLVGVAIFKICKPTWQFPLQHLTTFETIHSSLSGFLIDKENANKVLETLLNFIVKSNSVFNGIRINTCSPDFILSEEAKVITKDLGIIWRISSSWQRAALTLTDFNIPSQVTKNLSKNQRKNYRRHLNQLMIIGNVNYKLIDEAEIILNSAEEFIRLENLGWKGKNGTSLHSNSNHVSFFNEMIKGFSTEKRAFFAEIKLNNTTISSTSNLISGKTCFAFKVGWDPAYSKYSPGILNEILMLENIKEIQTELEFIDSSSTPNSYMNSLWPNRRTINNIVLSTSKQGNLTLIAIETAKKIKNIFSKNFTTQ